MKIRFARVSTVLGLFIAVLSVSMLASFEAAAWTADGFKKPTDAELKKKLNKIQYQVTQHEGTERPFENEFDAKKDDGIYVDIVSGEPLFSSKDKYDSSTGWPSFSNVINKAYIVEKQDRSLFGVRTEVRSKVADSHLGHVFDDGPKPAGLRYCMNSAAMRFIPAADLEKAGYPEFTALFRPDVSAAKSESESIVLGGGCFWCMEPPFEKLDGVTDVVSGYAGGTKETATYDRVSKGGTGHIEVVKVVYNPSKISLAEILNVYWRQIDPFDAQGQFCDKGEQYTSAIFYQNDKQRLQAETSLTEIMKTAMLKGASFATKIRSGSEFYKAEDYHQDYYKKNPIRYKLYRGNCGRDSRLEKVWGPAKK